MSTYKVNVKSRIDASFGDAQVAGLCSLRDTSRFCSSLFELSCKFSLDAEYRELREKFQMSNRKQNICFAFWCEHSFEEQAWDRLCSLVEGKNYLYSEQQSL